MPREAQPSRSTCPGCGGRGTVVSLGTVMACGRCHGRGTVDLVAEQIAKAREDAALTERIQTNIREHADLLEKLRESEQAEGGAR